MKWKLTRIGDFCDTGSGGTPARSQASRYFDGTIPWVKSGELKEDVIFDTEEHINEVAIQESAAKMVPAGALLVALYGATVGRIATLGVDAATNQAVCYIIPKHDVDRRFLFYALRTRVPHWLAQRVGGAQPNISQQIIKDTEIPLPPLSEQKRIAGILDQADGLRRKRQQALALTDQFLRSTFLDLFGDPVTNPKRWPTERMGLIADVCRGKFTPRPRNDPRFYGGQFPFIQTGDIANSRSIVRSWSQTLNEEGAAVSKAFDEGTIVVAIVGATIGETAILGFRTYAPDSVVGITPKPGVCTSEFLEYVLRSWKPIFRAQAPETARANINLETLRPINIPIPPIELQRRFSIAYRTAVEMPSKLTRHLDALFNSLVQRAFRGEL